MVYSGAKIDLNWWGVKACSAMKSMNILTLFILILKGTTAFPQIPDPLEFFPHHEGDIFEYEYSPSTPDYFQNIIIKDSLGDDGRYYIEFSYLGKWWIVDTTEFEVYGGGPLPIFKLDADSGDTWITFVDSLNNRFVQAELVNIFPAYVLGEDVIVKVIDNVGYEIIDSDTLKGLNYSSYYLSSKFGIIAKYGDPPGEPVYYLRGAKIDGKIYGTITSVEREYNYSPENFILSQNYPNPFNPTTTIKYTLPYSSNVLLKVYNSLGEEVTTLTEEYQTQGSYKINFSESSVLGGLSSGVYLCELKIKGGTISARGVESRMIKMVFIK